MNIIMKEINGNGGGKKEIAEGGGIDVKKLLIVLNNIQLWINTQLKNKKNNDYL